MNKVIISLSLLSALLLGACSGMQQMDEAKEYPLYARLVTADHPEALNYAAEEQVLFQESDEIKDDPSKVAPLKTGVCVRVYAATPKKPNSALRKLVSQQLTDEFNLIDVRTGNTLQRRPIYKKEEVRTMAKAHFGVYTPLKKKRRFSPEIGKDAALAVGEYSYDLKGVIYEYRRKEFMFSNFNKEEETDIRKFLVEVVKAERQPVEKTNQAMRIEGRLTGKVKWFNDTKGFGFIEGDTGQDLFVHQTDIKGDSARWKVKGVTCEYYIKKGSKDLIATDVEVK